MNVSIFDLYDQRNFYDVLFHYVSQDSAVGITTGYRLDGQGAGVRVPVGQDFSLLYVVQSGSEAHPASYPMVIGPLSPGVKRLGHEADHSPPSSAEVKNTWIYTSTPQNSSWCSAKLVKHRDTCTFYYYVTKQFRKYSPRIFR
jgi:hypothetical protein